jgi:ABC-type nickel/cobalt efflux system permease component RcnA
VGVVALLLLLLPLFRRLFSTTSWKWKSVSEWMELVSTKMMISFPLFLLQGVAALSDFA